MNAVDYLKLILEELKAIRSLIEADTGLGDYIQVLMHESQGSCPNCDGVKVNLNNDGIYQCQGCKLAWKNPPKATEDVQIRDAR